MTRDEVARRSALKHMHERHPYWDNVPHRGLTVDGRPAMTQIDPDKVGDFVLVTVRDPLIDYLADPAKQISGSLEDPELIGESRMFTSYTGTYEGARITVVVDGRRVVRTVSPAGSYLSSSDTRVHFGLGARDRFEAVDVRWPDGLRERFPGGDADRVMTLLRGSGERLP